MCIYIGLKTNRNTRQVMLEVVVQAVPSILEHKFEVMLEAT